MSKIIQFVKNPKEGGFDNMENVKIVESPSVTKDAIKEYEEATKCRAYLELRSWKRKNDGVPVTEEELLAEADLILKGSL